MTDHAERDLLLDLAYGELDDRAARRVREHVAGCASCRAELDELQGTRRLMSALPELPAPERGERILVAAAREAPHAHGADLGAQPATEQFAAHVERRVLPQESQPVLFRAGARHLVGQHADGAHVAHACKLLQHGLRRHQARTEA